MARLEVACFNNHSAIIAATNGAERIELCADASVGGITPSLETFQALSGDRCTPPVHVMIRPRGGCFVYTADEYDAMKEAMIRFRHAGAAGFVFGILSNTGRVDAARCRALVALAGRPCTFHRAFDELVENAMVDELDVLIDCGFTAVLTAGGKRDAVDGAVTLRALVAAAKGRIDIIVGGRVRSENIGWLMRMTGAEWFHSSALTDPTSEEASNEEVRTLAALVRLTDCDDGCSVPASARAECATDHSIHETLSQCVPIERAWRDREIGNLKKGTENEVSKPKLRYSGT